MKMMGKIIGKSATFGDFGATFDCWRRLFFNHNQPYKRDGLVEMTSSFGMVETTNQTSNGDVTWEYNPPYDWDDDPRMMGINGIYIYIYLYG